MRACTHQGKRQMNIEKPIRKCPSTINIVFNTMFGLTFFILGIVLAYGDMSFTENLRATIFCWVLAAVFLIQVIVMFMGTFSYRNLLRLIAATANSLLLIYFLFIILASQNKSFGLPLIILAGTFVFNSIMLGSRQSHNCTKVPPDSE